MILERENVCVCACVCERVEVKGIRVDISAWIYTLKTDLRTKV